jgi:hypothetical protein
MGNSFIISLFAQMTQYLVKSPNMAMNADIILDFVPYFLQNQAKNAIY